MQDIGDPDTIYTEYSMGSESLDSKKFARWNVALSHT